MSPAIVLCIPESASPSNTQHPPRKPKTSRTSHTIFTMLPSLLVAPLLAVVALAAPSPDLEDRAVKPCTLKTTTAVKYRKCASTSCTAVGQYAKGAKVKVSCVKSGQSVKGET